LETSGPSEEALSAAKDAAAKLMDEGALATILTGSHARGDAHEESDLDVRAVGDGPDKTLKREGGFLISFSAMSLEDNQKAFEDPDQVGEFVPGWRTSVLLIDPNGVGAELKQKAEEWDWDGLGDAAPRWVAEQMTLMAEEIHTLIGNLDQGQETGAAAIRSQIALDLAKVLSVHEQILYGSENDLWELVGEAMGDEYADRQKVALGLKGSDFFDSCTAVFELFELAATKTSDLLDERQGAVVDHALELASARIKN